jgi:ketosteroid isomerase-like protein
MSEESVDVVRRMFDAFNRGDVEGVVAAFDEGCELTEPPETPDRPVLGFHGHEGIREWMTNLREIAEVRFEPRSFKSSGTVILSESASSGQGQASGVPVEWTTFAVLHMGAGRIVRAQGFLTRDAALEAAGLRE